jgi:hypothetical protein
LAYNTHLLDQTIKAIIAISLYPDVKENRNIMSADIPNAFVQAIMPKMADGEERFIMKITGVLGELLFEIDPAKYGPFVVSEKGANILYVEILREC